MILNMIGLLEKSWWFVSFSPISLQNWPHLECFLDFQPLSKAPWVVSEIHNPLQTNLGWNWRFTVYMPFLSLYFTTHFSPLSIYSHEALVHKVFPSKFKWPKSNASSWWIFSYDSSQASCSCEIWKLTFFDSAFKFWNFINLFWCMRSPSNNSV